MNIDSTPAIFGTEASLTSWAVLKPSLSKYVALVNSAGMGEVCPSVDGIKEFFRRQIQNQMFTELGIPDKNTEAYSLLNVSGLSMPVSVKDGKWKLTTFDYMGWQLALESLPSINKEHLEHHEIVVMPSPTREYLSSLKAVRLNIKKISDGSELGNVNLDAISRTLNNMMLANIRKYVSIEGPHYYNMPHIQAVFFDTRLSDEVFNRYLITYRDSPVGYAIAEVVENVVTVSQLIVFPDITEKYGFTVQQVILAVLEQLKTKTTKVWGSALIKRYFPYLFSAAPVDEAVNVE